MAISVNWRHRSDDAGSIVRYAGKVLHETIWRAYSLNVRIAHFKRFLHFSGAPGFDITRQGEGGPPLCHQAF